MRGNSQDAGDKPLAAGDITDPIVLGAQAKAWAAEMLDAEKRGTGDTMVAAAHRLERDYGVAAGILLQLWSREPREMLVSRWMAVAQAWLRFRAEAERGRYERRRGRVADDHHPVLVRIADLVAGRETGGPRAGGPA